MPSTQWSTARMPVESHSHSGVCRLSQGSRMIARGIIKGWRSASLTWVFSLVTPAVAENSPPAIVVGTLIWRTVGRLELRRSAAPGPDPVDVVGVADIVGKAELDRLGAVGDRTAADGHDQVSPGGAGLVGRGNHRRARRMRRHRVEGADAARPQRAANLLDLVGFAVQRAADHQERALRAQPVQLFLNRFGCRPPEHDLIHRAEYDTTLMHVCPPRTFLALVAGLAAKVSGGNS